MFVDLETCLVIVVGLGVFWGVFVLGEGAGGRTLKASPRLAGNAHNAW